METLYCHCGCDQVIPPRKTHKKKPSRYLPGHAPPSGKGQVQPSKMPDKAPPCACGCGEEVELRPKHRWTGPPRFLPGHQSRGRPSPNRYVPSPDEIPKGTCECGCGLPTPIATVTKRRFRHFEGYPTPYAKGHNGRVNRGPSRYALQKGVRNTFEPATHPDNVRRMSQSWGGHGYRIIYAPEHPNARKDGSVAEHRLVMEQSLGRFLERHEQVHHINGDKTDNRIENLELWKRSQPSGVRHADYHCPGCRCGEVAA